MSSCHLHLRRKLKWLNVEKELRKLIRKQRLAVEHAESKRASLLGENPTKEKGEKRIREKRKAALADADAANLQLLLL